MMDDSVRQSLPHTRRLDAAYLRAFLPFAVVSAIHLLTLALGWSEASTVTKLAVIPALFVGFARMIPDRRGTIFVIVSIGMAFSWIGDALLEAPRETGFVLGLSAFLVAHLAYLALFAFVMRSRRVPWSALVYAAWWFALVGLLAPHIGSLLVPVSIYGLVIALAAAAAMGANRIATMGALLFLVSDSLLAFRLFYPGFEFWQMNATIMLFYIAGQGLIVVSAVRHARAARSVIPENTPQSVLVA